MIDETISKAMVIVEFFSYKLVYLIFLLFISIFKIHMQTWFHHYVFH